MVKVNRINISQIEGGYSDDSDKRPNGEMALYNDDNGGFDLVIHDGVNSTNLNKVLGKGKLYGHGADSADGNGYDTIKLIPDIPAYNGGSNQYIIIDPTGPNHVHIRAGGTIDNSNSELIVGGENSNVKIGAGTNPEITIESNNNTWAFGTDGALTVPGVIQNANSFEIKAGTAASTVEFLGQIDNGFGDGPGATLHVTSMINGTITDGMTIYGAGLPTEGWVLQFGTVMAPQGNGGTGNYYLPGANYLIGSQSFNNGDAPNSTWIFATSGNLTIPGSISFPDGSVQTSAPTNLPTVVQLGSVSGTINTDATLGDIFDLTLAASGTLANPASGVDGQSLRWRITHDANNLTLNFGDKFKIPSSASSPLPISSTSGSMDLLGATYDQSRDKWDVISFVPGY